MRCGKCGTENLEHAIYCKRCGASLQKVTGADSRKRRLLAAAVLLVVLAGAVVAIVLYMNHQNQAEYNGMLQTADKYLQELDYEKAEVSYLKAIEIQPKQEEAYLKLADIYTQQGDYEEAEKILQQGVKNKKSEKMESRLDAVRLTAQKGQYSEVFEQYLDCIENDYYIDEITDSGADAVGDFVNSELLMASQYSDTFQIYYALKDIDKNGTPELFIGAGDSADEVGKYDVLACTEEKEPVRLFPQELFGYRTNFTVFTNGIFEITSSGSVSDYGVSYYRISKNGYTPKLVDSISTGKDYVNSEGADEQPASVYYHDSENNQEITKEEFEAIQQKYRQEPEETFQWIPLTEDTLSENDGDSGQYASYYEVCKEYQKKYGEGKIAEKPGIIEGTHEVLEGLCVAELLDFNGDGDMELLIGYAGGDTDFSETGYCYEVWAWKNGQVEKVLMQPANHIEGVAWIETTAEDTRTYMVKDQRMENGAGSAEYLEYDGESFDTRYDIIVSQPELGEAGSLNGSAATDEEITQLHNKLARPYCPEAAGDLYVNYCNEDGRRFFPLNTDGHVPTGTEEHQDLQRVLLNTEQTLQTVNANRNEG